MLRNYLSSITVVLIAASAAFAQASTSLTLETPSYWGHLSYTITGARLDLPTGSDRGNVGGRQYKGELTGTTLTISGNAVSDNTSSGPGSGDYYELAVSVTVGKEHREYSYIAPKGEKLSRPFSLTVPVVAGASGSFTISLLEQNADNGAYGWVVGGNLSPAKSAVLAPAPTPYVPIPPKRVPKPTPTPNNTRVADPDVAMVTDAFGLVTVQSGKETYVAELAQTLRSGNVIICGAGSSLSVLIIDSQIEYIARCPGRLVIGDGGVTGDVTRAQPLAANLPKNLDLAPKHLVEGAGMNVSNVQPPHDQTGLLTGEGLYGALLREEATNFSMDEPVNRLIISTGRIGLLEVTRSGSGYTGRMNVTGKGWETLRDVTLDNGTITFDRATVPTERYVGKLDNGGITGTFSTGGNDTKTWKAVIRNVEEPPQNTAVVKSGAVEKELFSNNNIYGVENGGNSPLVTFSSPTTVTFILTYHWNSGRGAPAGTIALKRDDGTVFGPWQVTVNSRVYWEARPSVVIPAGRYQVIDSDPSTWAQNSGTGGLGIVRIMGY